MKEELDRNINRNSEIYDFFRYSFLQESATNIYNNNDKLY